MYKKEVDGFNRKNYLSKKAQITVFMIIGLLILFAFIFVIKLSSDIKKEQLAEVQETVLSKMFRKEAFRIFVEDCLSDELERGLFLIGKQGRLWSNQPGGSRRFEEGVSGITYTPNDEEGRIFYGITREDYLQHENAYPCDNESFSPEFCMYRYPNTKAGYGRLEVRSSTIENDLRRYLINKTEMCVKDFVMNNVSNKAELEPGDLNLEFNLLDEGVDVKVDYPLKLKLGTEEFFQLSKFDFFYPTKFKVLLDSAVVFPLMMDWKYIDFNYSRETLESSSFTYGNEISVRDCFPFKDYFKCSLNLQQDKYTSLGVEMSKESLPNGDDLYSFKTASYEVINSPQRYEYRLVRQNRAPALDYVNRSECPTAGYDYLVILNDPTELGWINASLFSVDPDEDKLSYGFEGDLKQEGNKLEFKPLVKGWLNVTAYAEDEHGVRDWQEVRILVDREIKLNVSLGLPYNFKVEGQEELVPYSELVKDGFFFASKEDPLFINVKLPEDSPVAILNQIKLDYKSKEDNFTIALPYSEKENCLSLPWKEGLAGCDLNAYSDEEVKNWPSRLTDEWFTLPYFRKLSNEGTLNLSFSVNYCAEGLERSSTVDLSVKECLPHVNPEHPFPSPYQDYKLSEGVFSQEEIDPLAATHSCCSPTFQIYKKEDNVECFVNPVPGCYGKILGYTLTEPVKFKGLVLEQQFVTCDGIRGNTCNGPKEYKLWEEDGKEVLQCGTKGVTGCEGIADRCEGQKAWSVIEADENGKAGWCSGTMGCSNFCSSEVVYTGPEDSSYFPSNFTNTLAKNKRVTSETGFDFHCGCTPEDNEKKYKCDSNFDGHFEGICTTGAKCTEGG
ncbi:MAG: hypothetical protein KKA62_01330 [Nanoarchaeota archaeon]|nr:hypothetical protein [Nanoarchaeota archaeon]MBU1644680.1 hypothetical protein [Nanoarchaeota archaeon]MBU1976575.1 hypothetical protein [Nanoarchaeota archaeon]